MTNDELYHYGVLGMKWGVHRSKVHSRKSEKFKNKALKAKQSGKTEKAKKMEFRAKQQSTTASALLKKHKKLAGSAFNRLNNQSVGKTLVQSVVIGSYGALKYNQARAKNVGRAQSLINGVLNQIGNMATGGLISVVSPRTSDKNN